jgi:hypothetical protein
MRIGSLWKRVKEDKSISVSGEIESDIGINLPAGQKLSCRLVKNEKYVEGGKQPLYFIEAWIRRDLPELGAPGEPGADDDIPF